MEKRISEKNKAARKKVQFKKGNKKAVGFGRPKLTEAEKELTLKTRTQFRNILNKYMITDQKELEKLYKSKNLPVLDGMVIKSLLNAFRTGDQTQMNWFLNHSLGKEKETSHIKFSGSIESSEMIPKEFTKEELLTMKAIHAAKKKREKKS